MAWDPSGDFAEIVDGLEPVTLIYREGATVEVTNAHRNQVTTMEVEAFGGDVKMGDTIWQWPTAESVVEPPLGSTITDGDANVWTILQINEQVVGSKWSATCRELAVEARLDTLVTIQQATYVKSSSGVAVPVWSDAYASVRARVQPITTTAEVEHDASTVHDEYRIVLGSDLEFIPGTDYRVLDSDLDIYTVTRYEQPERIDTLPALICERVGTSSGV